MDLHIHVGMNKQGKWVKIPSSKNLTVENILHTALKQKGLDIIGIVDCLSPLVQQDLLELITTGDLLPIAGGGYIYQDRLVLLLGAEIESREAGGGLAHSLFFLPTLEKMQEFTKSMSCFIKNPNISSQNAHMPICELYNIAKKHNAKIIPAHIFTPFKSVYGNCTDKMAKLFDGHLPNIAAVELGLSADSFMASRISELKNYTFLANSDAHSLQNIAREFSLLECDQSLNFENIFSNIQESKIKTLYGLNPKLGKYYLTRCGVCGEQNDYQNKKCSFCQGRVVKGVSERIEHIADNNFSEKANYIYHFPLSELPGIGKKTLLNIYENNYTEFDILYKLNEEKISNLLGEKVFAVIKLAKSNKMNISSGGAGQYGYVII